MSRSQRVFMKWSKNCTTNVAAVIKKESYEDLLRKLNEEMIELSAKHAENDIDSDANWLWHFSWTTRSSTGERLSSCSFQSLALTRWICKQISIWDSSSTWKKLANSSLNTKKIHKSIDDEVKSVYLLFGQVGWTVQIIQKFNHRLRHWNS